MKSSGRCGRRSRPESPILRGSGQGCVGSLDNKRSRTPPRPSDSLQRRGPECPRESPPRCNDRKRDNGSHAPDAPSPPPGPRALRPLDATAVRDRRLGALAAMPFGNAHTPPANGARPRRLDGGEDVRGNDPDVPAVRPVCVPSAVYWNVGAPAVDRWKADEMSSTSFAGAALPVPEHAAPASLHTPAAWRSGPPA